MATQTERTVRSQCSHCSGTGIRPVGHPEGRYFAVCRSCNGSGCVEIRYVPFEERQTRTGVEKVYRYGGALDDIVDENTERLSGGATYQQWLDNPEIVDQPGWEARQEVCPAWWFLFYPQWRECQQGVPPGNRFTDCPHYSQKESCWRRWDQEVHRQNRERNADD